MVMEEEQSHMELASESVPVPQVQTLTENMNDETGEQLEIPRKKPRQRKKALHAAILKQMEFYFGDANLSRDRFLGNLVEEDPYVDLNIFLRFNKIRALTTDLNQIVKALRKSTILSVSEDGTKVCRITPISQKENSDECTVYVQRLPLDADHEWLSNLFTQYGPVSYVSIPRYKSNKKIKGFAFVEFEKLESAEICIKAFQEKGCVLPSQTAPDELLSITTFHEEEQMEREEAKGQHVKDMESSECGKKEIDAEVSKSEVGSENDKKSKKRKHKLGETMKEDGSESSKEVVQIKSEDAVDSENEKKSKKRKHKLGETTKEDGSESSKEVVEIECEDGLDSEKEKKSKKRKQRQNETSNDDEECIHPDKTSESNANDDQNLEGEGEDANDNDKNDVDIKGKEVTEGDSKKKRKRKRHVAAEKIDTADIGMQVMPKKDWKRLRNKYLQLQRNKMKSLKQHLRRARWNQWNVYDKSKDNDKSKVAKEDSREEKEDNKKDDKSTQRFVFTPGVIVKIEMDEPCTDPKSFKMELKGNNSVKYIDVTEGSTEAFIRCDTAEAAKSLAVKSNEERTMSILQDKEETEYWDKMTRDREEKLGKKIRVKQRGRDKLLKKAEKELGKHIKFDEV